jgi:hypothetical protein
MMGRCLSHVSAGWRFRFSRAKRVYREVSSASAAAELLLFACPKRSNQEKGHPEIAPAFGGFASGLRGFSTVRPCTDEKLARFLRAPAVAADPPARRRDLREGRSRAKSRGARAVVLGSPFPSRAPSSAAGLGGKARMFEAMDGRVRAGPSLASSAGLRAQRGARVGRAFSCPLLFARAKRSGSAAAEADETSRRTRIKRAEPNPFIGLTIGRRSR